MRWVISFPSQHVSCASFLLYFWKLLRWKHGNIDLSLFDMYFRIMKHTRTDLHFLQKKTR
jgi:hypothetical protein